MRISDWSSDVCSSDLAVMASADDQSDTIGIADLILHIDAKLRIALFRQKIIGQNGKTGRNRIVDIDRRDHGPGPAARIRGRRSEERRVGKACVSTFSYRCCPYR